MTTAVAWKVSQADNDNHDVNDQLLGRSPGIQTLRAIAFDDHLSSIDVVVAFARETGECIWLLGVTLEDITLGSPGDIDQRAGHNEQGAAVVVVAAEPLQRDAWMTATGMPTPKGGDLTAGLGSCVAKPLTTRPPGYSLPLRLSFLNSLANIDGAVRRYSRKQMTIESEEAAYEHRTLKQKFVATARDNVLVTRDDSPAEGYLLSKQSIIDNMWIGLTRANMPISEMLGDGWQSIFVYGNIHEVCGNLPYIIHLLSMAILKTSNCVQRCR